MKSRKSTNRSKGMILYKIKTFTLLLLVNPFPSSLATCLEAPFQTNPFQLFLVERVLSFGGNLFFFAFSLMTESTIFNGIVPLFLRGARLDYSAPPSLSSTLPPSHTSFFPPTNIPINNLFSDGRKLDHANIEISLLPAPHNRKVLFPSFLIISTA